ncbi:MAG TPA: DUF3307 domain-containing protein [Anaerolineae bacterium]|nr:DUF3307 domain-containing protein [Anaerolineae bacterium]
MSVMLRLLLAHMLGDFVTQPLVLVSMKRQGWRGITIHSAIVTALTAALAWGQFPHWWAWTLFLGLSHAFIEHFRTFYVKNGDRGGLYHFLLDQTAHLGVIIFIAAVSVNWRLAELASLFNGTASVESRLMVYLIALIFLVWSAPVFEAEMVATLVGCNEDIVGGKSVRIKSMDRLLGALERLAAVSLVLAGCFYLAPASLLLRIYVQRGQWRGQQSRNRLIAKIATSFLLAVATGLVLRAVPLSLPFQVAG